MGLGKDLWMTEGTTSAFLATDAYGVDHYETIPVRSLVTVGVGVSLSVSVCLSVSVFVSRAHGRGEALELCQRLCLVLLPASIRQ